MAEEERAKASEEKFQKLKNMYTQIRDEHIKLLRQASVENFMKFKFTKVICAKSKRIFQKSKRYLKLN